MNANESVNRKGKRKERKAIRNTGSPFGVLGEGMIRQRKNEQFMAGPVASQDEDLFRLCYD
jgi:hypothetical protein